MSDEPKRRSWGWIALALFMAFLLYPLSAGPFLFIVTRYWEPEEWGSIYVVAYGPLERACDNCRLLDSAMHEYTRIWERSR